jgi:hypothetical protein
MQWASVANGPQMPPSIPPTSRLCAVPRKKIGGVFGHLDAATMTTVSRALVTFLELG